MIKYSIVIPVFNNKDSFANCLAAIKKNFTKNSELIIVDDCSVQPQVSQIAKKFADKFIKLNKNCGAGRARNCGVKKARGDFLIFIDSDILISPNFFVKLIKKIDKLPSDCCLQGVYSFRTPVKNIYSQYKNLYHYYNFFHRIDKSNFSYVSSHCFVIPRKIFNHLKGFNTKIKTVIEDADLSFRLLKKGYKILLDRSIIVSHLKKFSLLNLLINDAKLSFAKTKHILRNLFKNNKEKLIVVSGGRMNEMYPIIINVLIAPLFILASLYAFIYNYQVGLYFLIFLFLAFIFLNFNFFFFIEKKKGLKFLVKLIPLFYLDMLFAFSGVFWGVFDYYFLGRRY